MIDFVLAGAPKCGTTSIASALDQHSQIEISNPKETFFFNAEFNEKRVYRTTEQYKSAYSSYGKLRGDGSIWSMYSPTFCQSLISLNPKAKVVVILRSPDKFVSSLYHYNFDKGYENIDDIFRALDAESDRKSGGRIPSSCPEPTYLLYRQNCRYRDYIAPIQRELGGENLFICDFDKVNKSTLPAKLFKFLGLPNEDVRIPHLNPTSYSTSLFNKLAVRPLVRIARAMDALGIPAPRTGVVDAYRRSSRKGNEAKRRNVEERLRSLLAQEISEYICFMEEAATA